MSSNFAFTVGTAVASKIGPVYLACLQRKLHGHEVRRSNSDEDLVVLRAVFIIQDHKSLTSPYTFKINDDVPETIEYLFPP